MNGKYIMAAVNMLIVTVGLCVLELTKFDGVAALIFILPMVAETLEATADYTMQKHVCTKIIDIISFICSCGTTILIICYKFMAKNPQACLWDESPFSYFLFA